MSLIDSILNLRAKQTQAPETTGSNSNKPSKGAPPPPPQSTAEDGLVEIDIRSGVLFLDNDNNRLKMPENRLVRVTQQDEDDDEEKTDSAKTLAEMIAKNYSGTEGNDSRTTKILAEIMQANPALVDKIYDEVYSQNYDSIADVDVENLLHTDLSQYEDFQDDYFIMPNIAFEEFEDAAAKAGNMQIKPEHYHTDNNQVEINSGMQGDSTAQEAKSLGEAITLNYGVEEGSAGYYYILNEIANDPANAEFIEKAFSTSSNPTDLANGGKIDDTTRALAALNLDGVKIALPSDIVLTIMSAKNMTQGIIDPQQATSDEISYWNLPQLQNQLTADELQNVNTIYDFMQYYTGPQGEDLKNVEEGSYAELYTVAVAQSLLTTYPNLFDEEGNFLKDSIAQDTILKLPPAMYNINEGKRAPKSPPPPSPTPPTHPTPPPTPNPTGTPDPTGTPNPPGTPNPTNTPNPTGTPNPTESPCDTKPPVVPDPTSTPRPTLEPTKTPDPTPDPTPVPTPKPTPEPTKTPDPTCEPFPEISPDM